MTQQYTKGPWVHYGADRHVMSKDFSMPSICQAPKGKQGKNAQWQANARLIAAAPELLEALEKALEMLEELKIESGRGVDWGEEDAFRMGEWFEHDEIAAMKIAGAAIAKAKGEPQ